MESEHKIVETYGRKLLLHHSYAAYAVCSCGDVVAAVSSSQHLCAKALARKHKLHKARRASRES